jgi:hypothetical protein
MSPETIGKKGRRRTLHHIRGRGLVIFGSIEPETNDVANRSIDITTDDKSWQDEQPQLPNYLLRRTVKLRR